MLLHEWRSLLCLYVNQEELLNVWRILMVELS